MRSSQRDPLETLQQEGSGSSAVVGSLSTLRARHESDRARLGVRKLELAPLFALAGAQVLEFGVTAEPASDAAGFRSLPTLRRRSGAGRHALAWCGHFAA
jgi:hypothetical protein